MKTTRRTLIGSGALLMAYAISSALWDPDISLGVLVFLIAILIIHDGLFLPLTIAAGTLIDRLVPMKARTMVRATAVGTLAVGVVALLLTLGP